MSLAHWQVGVVNRELLADVRETLACDFEEEFAVYGEGCGKYIYKQDCGVAQNHVGIGSPNDQLATDEELELIDERVADGLASGRW